MIFKDLKDGDLFVDIRNNIYMKYVCHKTSSKVILIECNDGPIPCGIRNYDYDDYEDVRKVNAKYFDSKTGSKIVAPLLTKDEKIYLENVIRPYKEKVTYIRKCNFIKNMKRIVIGCTHFGYDYKNDCESDEVLEELNAFPPFKDRTKFTGLLVNRLYTLEDLNLFENEKNNACAR